MQDKKDETAFLMKENIRVSISNIIREMLAKDKSFDKSLYEEIKECEINGRKYTEKYTINDITDIEYKGWWENGQLAFSGKFKPGGLVEHKEWYNNGQLKYEENYIKNIFETKWMYDDGQLKTHQIIEKDKLESKSWYYDGKISYTQQGKKRDNKLYSEDKGWWNNGTLSYQSNYLNGELDGECKRWYKNGELMSDNTYTKGMCNYSKKIKL